jgi:hypothetical protein
LSVIRPWIFPFAVMGSAAFAMGSVLSVTDASVAAYYAAVTLFAIVCGVYISHQVAREENRNPPGRTRPHDSTKHP